MRKYLFPALLFFFSCTAPSDKYPRGIEHVIVIGVDGLSPDGIRNANTPVMDDMIANGAVKWNVRTVLTTASSQNWASMIMGAGPEVHGIIDNDWERDDHSLPPIVAGEEGIFPTIFGRIREAKPQAEIGTVYNWSGFGRLFEKKAVNYDKTFKTEDATATDFVEYIKNKKPVFGFVHFDHVDHAGHHDGHGTPIYYEAVAKADSLVGEVLKAIKEAGMEENTLVIITADHGGIGKGHGGPTPEEGEIAMILHGKGVKKGYVVQQQVYTYDLAATIAFVFNITAPYAWTGRPVKPAFEGFDEPANLWKGKEAIAAPSILPGRVLYKQAGGLYIDQPAEVSMKPNAANSVIHYTIDGTEPDKNSPVYTDKFQLDNTAVVQAKAFDDKGNESIISTAYFRVLKPTGNNGLNVRFYHGANWKQVPVFSKLNAAKTWTTYEFGFEEEQIKPLLQKGSSSFGLVFTGYVQIDQPGKYKFYTQSDDGSILYINDKKVVDNDGNHGVKEAAGDITLEAGKHSIRVEYFNGGGGYWLDVFYKAPDGPKQLVPADKLFLR
ncbi:MAG: alkaline phosphatase family protein [Chitinophagaceae bacterium]|nr:alkaline phosphatase family protein [Chitinophagaceae bacterium]MCW5927797.1 alkaline phosphatase family protein [Chitinophagaceae bacterium]